MAKELVFIHGRSQQGYDSIKLKKLWVDSLKEGLAKHNLTLPIPEENIRFPYFGDTLAGLVSGISEDEVAEIILRGDGPSDAEAHFIREVLLETLKAKGITDEQIQTLSNQPIVERSPLNWEWVQTGLKALDYYVPYASSATVALRTRDVHMYLNNSVFRRIIDTGVARAVNPDVETVVAGHSLGAVVSYNVLHGAGADNNWKVPLYVTVGGPLAVTAIKAKLPTVAHPRCVGAWFNAMDERDIVPLYPLDQTHFDIDPPIENKTDVDNFVEGHHGIRGYLADPDVAKKIHDALS